MGGGELHLLGDLARPDVQRTTEDAGEAQDVVDLVRVVATTRRDYPRVPHRLLGHDLGVGIGHGEDYRVVGHRLEVIYREYAGHQEPQEQVRPPRGVVEPAGAVLGVGVLGEPLLGGVQALAAPVHYATRVAADDVPDPGVHQDL